MRRRTLLAATGALALRGLAGCASVAEPAVGGKAAGRVVVVGGGYGGATASKYLRLFSAGRIDVTLVEPEAAFVSCPLSNLVIGGTRRIEEMTVPYAALGTRHGVRVVRDRATAIDATRREVTLGGGTRLAYDRLVLAPGVEMMFDEVADLREASRDGRIVQAWTPGTETLVLRRQLEAMPDGGTFAIAIPETPYRCPPGPYERACLVADYFKRAKPRAKVLVLDANEDITSKGPLFRKAWAERYAGRVEYRPQCKATAVDATRGLIRFEIQDDVHADVLNVLPPMRAGAIAVQAGLADANGRWCSVEFLDFQSKVAPGVHVLGDAIQVAPLMPKSGHMANGHAKVAAAAIVAALAGREIDPAPMLTNTCYSFVDPKSAMHVASVHAYAAAERTFLSVPGSGGLSAAPSEVEGDLAWSWARTIWADALG
jgi:NADPH-dependent 2,4-dienoyl-CoA reductase/sulfur reductase-like enzyme